MRNNLILSTLLLLALAGTTAGEPETGEPVYLAFIRQSNPVAHFRLDSSAPESIRNLYAEETGLPSLEAVVHHRDAIRVVPTMSPREFWGTNRMNGLDYNNTGLNFSHALSRTNSAVVIPGESIPDFAAPHADEFSLSVWIKALPRQVDRAGIVSRKAGDGLDSYQFALSLWSSKYDIIMNQPDGQFRSFYTPVGPDGDWQHLVAVLDSKGWHEDEAGMFRFYVNGERVLTHKTGNHTRTQMITSQADVIIGGIAYQQPDGEGFNNGFDGILDELTLWDRALSDKEVAELHKSAIIGRRPLVIIIGSID